MNYADRGLQYDQEGANRKINVGYATSAERRRPTRSSPADPECAAGHRAMSPRRTVRTADEGRGYLWDAALRAGLACATTASSAT